MPLPKRPGKPGGGPKAAVTAKSTLPPENPQKKAMEAARKGQVTIPPRDVFDNYKMGEIGRDVYEAISGLDLENASTSGVYALLGKKLPAIPYVADFQTEARDVIHGAMRALAEKRRLPRPEIMRHVYAALIFFAPKEVIPVSITAQVVAQEAMYAKWTPMFLDEFPMRTMAYALGHAVAVLQLSGSVGVNPYYTHSQDNMEAVLRGLGEGIKSATITVAIQFSQAIANLQKFQQGIEDGYEGVKKEYFTRTAAGMLGKILGK